MTCDEPADSEIDRSMPVGVFNYGLAFFKAAQHLHHAVRKRELRLRCAPIYYNYSHAMELTLKSFLRAKGMSDKKIRNKFGHDLQRLWNACIIRGLEIKINKDTIDEVVILLDEPARYFTFRYIETGFKRFPDLEKVNLATVSIMSAVQPHIPLARPLQVSAVVSV